MGKFYNKLGLKAKAITEPEKVTEKNHLEKLFVSAKSCDNEKFIQLLADSELIIDED